MSGATLEGLDIQLLKSNRNHSAAGQ